MKDGVPVHPFATVGPHGRGDHEVLGDIGTTSERQMTWKVRPGASLADLATIELRRITDVLQVDHASLFLRDPDDPQRTVAVAETGLPAREVLPEHDALVARVLRTSRASEAQGPDGPAETSCAALASPLVYDDRAVGALLVVTRRANRRLGPIDAEVVERATQTLVERFVAPGEHGEPAARRFTRDATARRS
jgi:hypothetical protein